MAVLKKEIWKLSRSNFKSTFTVFLNLTMIRMTVLKLKWSRSNFKSPTAEKNCKSSSVQPSSDGSWTFDNYFQYLAGGWLSVEKTNRRKKERKIRKIFQSSFSTKERRKKERKKIKKKKFQSLATTKESRNYSVIQTEIN